MYFIIFPILLTFLKFQDFLQGLAALKHEVKSTFMLFGIKCYICIMFISKVYSNYFFGALECLRFQRAGKIFSF